MTTALLDDHLLRDVLVGDFSPDLIAPLDDHDIATTSLYLHRLCRSVVSARGGALTGSWPVEQRRELGRRLAVLPDAIEVVPMRQLAFRMAEIVGGHRLSALGAEAVAAAEHLGASLCVWEGDEGPGIRAAAATLQLSYRTLGR